MAPAAEWLLDNFYLVRRDLGRIREALRRKRRLPRLSGGGLRVLALTDAFTEACGGRAEASMLRAFLRGAGEETDLEEAELGLLESALRMSLLKRHAQDAVSDPEAVQRLLIKAGEEGEGFYEAACARLHREWAARLRRKEPLPAVSRRYFGE